MFLAEVVQLVVQLAMEEGMQLIKVEVDVMQEVVDQALSSWRIQ